jgi:GT2 family glycosyltransferase
MLPTCDTIFGGIKLLGSLPKSSALELLQVFDRHALQRQLLNRPNQPTLWQQLGEIARTRLQEQGAVPVPLAGMPNVQSKPRPAVTPRSAPRQTEPAVGGVHPGAHRPIQRRYLAEGSSQAQAVLQEQLAELQTLVAAGQVEAVMERLGLDLVVPLASHLPVAAAYCLGHGAYQQERFEVAAPLLEAVVAAGEQEGDILPWAELYLALSRRGLGESGRARDQLDVLVADYPSHDVGFHAQVALAWLDLNTGATQAAANALEQLRQLPQASTNLAELDLLGRVLSTLEWLEANNRDQLSHTVDLASCDGVAAAIDAIRLSRCGRVLQLQGWLVDPGQQLRELCLVRGERVWRLNLGQARYSNRPDLAEVVERCGGDASVHAGLSLTQIALAEEAVPLQGGEAAELFAVLCNGNQFCLRRTLQSTDLSTEQVKTVLDAAIQEPCRLVSANLLHRARELWSAVLLGKLQSAAEHKLFGAPPAQPELSVVVPLYGRVDFMEYQLNWFNAWQRRKGPSRVALQLIYVLDDPRLKQECLALAKRCHTLYATPFELVVNPENIGFAGANNRGSAFAKAPLLLLLNSDVLPAQDDSMELMLRAMQQHPGQIGALGARLLFDNGAIQHQGMTFVKEVDLDGELGRVWLNEHPLKGVKVHLAEGDVLALQEVEAATAACLMLNTELYRQLRGLSTHYIVGDFEDSDLCLKLRSQGHPILVDLSASFFHLERQSVDLASSSNLMKTKLVTANAVTHHQRWCSAIERLQRSRLRQ